ncbi:hypothetical protein GGI09_008817 [Coemansia sp. S100]|nr:hypothetical protein GGI09_008817 [Coemansia sp. S100]
MELGDIMHRAGRLEARRLANQDFTPLRLRRMASLERVADGLDSLSDARMEQRMVLSSQQVRELFLVGIAARLGRVDGCTESLLVAVAVGTAGVLLAYLRPTPSVHGCNVVIVGASSGIGHSLALEYAQRGANLVLCARRQEQLEEVAVACRQLSVNVSTVVGDITQRETQLALHREAAARGVDYLVLNAGAISVRPIADLWPADTTDEDELRKGADRASDLLQHILDINAVAPAVVAGLFIPLLAQSRGSVVVVSSVAGLVAAPTRSLYSASKHAVTGYFNAFRMEVAALGISVTVAYPGTVDTDLRHSAVDIHVGGGDGPAGSDAGKLSPASCAKQIVRAAALRQHSLITPWQYALGPVLYAVVPSVVDYLAKKKYGFI